MILLSLAKMQLSSTLTLSPHMIWYSGQRALFLFLLARAAPAFLPTALSVALRPLFPFQQAQYVQVFPLKPAPFHMLFTGRGSTNKSAISLLFSSPSILLSFCPCHPVLSSIFPLISNSVADVVGSVFSLLLFYQATMGPWTFVSPGEQHS